MTDRSGPAAQAAAVLPPTEPPRSGAIVLVHGAWVGEWSWLPVEPGLRASGRAVHAVSLTGHGAMRHRSGPHVTLADHVADVINLVETFDLRDVTLVGHSYGGRVITGAVGQLAERVTALVYLDAHTPVAPDPGQTPARVEAAAANGNMLPFPEEYRPDSAHVGGPEGVQWFTDRLMPQSFACFTAPWLKDLPTEVRRTFVFASGYAPTRFGHYAELCRDDPAWRYHELDGPHFLMFSHQTEVVEIILDA
ncbi:MAG: alpha/beta hydrolase family protein [Actinomycetota bacterium]